MSETKTRTITALIVAPLVVLCFVSYESLIGLVAAVVLLASYELLNISFSKIQNGSRYYILIGVASSVAFPVFYGLSGAREGLSFLIAIFLVNSIVGIITIADKSGVWNAVLGTNLSILYIAGCLSFFLPIYLNHGPGNALLTLSAVWIFDIFAYFTGKRYGKHKISKTFSPLKSLEGVIGGLIATFLYTVLFKLVFEFLFDIDVMSVSMAAIFSVLVAVMGTFGDIFESALKRFFKVKHSGSALPGHGGMLDRIDGLLFVTPTTYFLLQFLKF